MGVADNNTVNGYGICRTCVYGYECRGNTNVGSAVSQAVRCGYYDKPCMNIRTNLVCCATYVDKEEASIVSGFATAYDMPQSNPFVYESFQKKQMKKVEQLEDKISNPSRSNITKTDLFSNPPHN